MLELIVVLVTLGLLAAIAVPSYLHIANGMRVAAAEQQVTLILAQARAIKAQDRSLTWTEAVEASVQDIAPDGEPFLAAGTTLVASGDGRNAADICALPDGIAYGPFTYQCSHGSGTRVDGDTVHADPSKWSFTTNPTGWRAMSLHTRHIIVQDHGVAVTLQLAAGHGVWVYGRLHGNGLYVETVATTTTTTTTAPVAPTDPDDTSGGVEVWNEDDGDDAEEIGDVIEGTDDAENPTWWTGKSEGHCKFGGWMTNYPPGLWKNQGDCVSFYSTGGTNLPNGPLADQYPTP